MNKAAITLLLSGLALTFAHSANFVQGILDPELVGTWVGSTQAGESNEETREWVQVRKADGTVTTHFTIKHEDIVINTYTNKGRWWTYEGTFFETFSDTRNEPDVYQYTFIDSKALRFTKIANDGNYEVFDPYTFTETKQ